MEKSIIISNIIHQYKVSKLDKKNRCKVDGIIVNDLANITMEHKKLWEEYAQVKDELFKITQTMEKINERITNKK